MNKILVITGQTATGKTKLALEYARKQKGELINADASQIYKFLDIVTGKDLDLIGQIPIHLLSIIDPKENFSSYDWTKIASEKIKEITKRGKLPIIVGGTYFYIAHLLYGIQTEGIGPNWKLRKKLAKMTIEELQKTLKDLSVQMFKQLNISDRNNPRRLIRRIEITKAKQKINENTNFLRKKLRIEFIGLRFKTKEKLAAAIKKRVEERLKMGAIEEVKELLNKGYDVTDPGLKANATFEIAQYLRGEISLEELKHKWITLDMQYSKRQYTLMKRDPNIKWIEV